MKTLRPLLRARAGDRVRLELVISDRAVPLLADQLLLIVVAVNSLREVGCQVNIASDLDAKWLQQDARMRYASRVDFFRWLPLRHLEQEAFIRRPGKDRFTEITPFNRSNYMEVGRRITRVVIANTQVDQAVQHMLDFCLFEIMDNVLVHSAYPLSFGGKGWCCAQYFPSAKEIRLLIADTGIGIHGALTRPPGSRFKTLCETEALRRCVERGITNGEGMGFGLFATLAFIRQNKGELLIYSGTHYGSFAKGRFEVKSGAYWQGTMVFMRIRTDVPVNYSSFMPPGHPMAADYDFLYKQ